MRKLFLLLVILLVGCREENAVNIPENVPKDELSSVTFNLDHEEGKTMFVVRRSTMDVYVPAEEYEMEWVDDKYTVTIKKVEGTMFEYFFAEETDTGIKYERNGYDQITYRTVIFQDGDVHNEYLEKDGTDTVNILVTYNNEPIQGIIVEAEGKKFMTYSDGYAHLTDIHKDASITIYDVSDTYKPLTITGETEVSLEMNEFTTVTFKVENETEANHVRVAGLLGAFGYKYIQQNSRYFDEGNRQMLFLEKDGDMFTGEIELPLNSVLTYTYTSAVPAFGVEMVNHRPVIRDILVTEDLVIEDTVVNFGYDNEVPVVFNNGTDEDLYIQMYWQSIPMNEEIILYLIEGEEVEYRYSKSVEGYSSEDLGNKALDYYYGYDEKRSITVEKDIIQNDTINGWLLFDKGEYETNIGETRRIFTGIMMADYWNSTYYHETTTMLSKMKELNPEYLMISPVWNFSDIVDEPELEPFGQQWHTVAMPSVDLEHWSDVNSDFKLAMYQQVNPEMLDGGIEDFFNSGAKSDEWWEQFLDTLYDFYMFYAVEAEKNGIELIRLPDTFMGETLNMFSNQEQAKMFDDFMNQMIDDMEEVYSGKIYSSIEIFNNFDYYWTYLERMDYLSNKFWYSVIDIEASLESFRYHLEIYKEESETYGVPFFVDQLAFFSEELTIEDDYEFYISRYYDEMFNEINKHDWIEGVVIFGYPYTEGGSIMTVADDVISDWFTAFKKDS